MKKLIILLLVFVQFSCLQRPTFPCVVTDIAKSKWQSYKCVYYINSLDKGWEGSFVDSINKYDIGDTIKTIR